MSPRLHDVLDLKIDRVGVPPRDAATLVLVRDGAAGLEVFCVERNKKSRFLGGAIVFPGGKVDEGDASEAWASLVTEPRPAVFARDATHLRALAVAACRESLEEAAILPVARGSAGPAGFGGEVGGPASASDADLLALRARLAAEPDAIAQFLRARAMRLDLAALHPLGRWITPEAEARRFDARFFLAIAPEGQSGAHDEHETMASFWAPPAELLRRFAADEVQLAPPTHRLLALLGEGTTTADAIALAAASCLDPICPRLVPQGDTLALALPGDPEHEVREVRVRGSSRYVLRGDRWRSENPPH